MYCTSILYSKAGSARIQDGLYTRRRDGDRLKVTGGSAAFGRQAWLQDMAFPAAGAP